MSVNSTFDLMSLTKIFAQITKNSQILKFSNNNLDINFDIANLRGRTVVLLFWGVVTSNTSGKHQPLKWCDPRFNDRGDNSAYNRSFTGLKTIIAVLCGFTNSLIAKASINLSVFHTFFGNQNTWSLALLNCFRPFGFYIQGGKNA